MLNGYLLPKVDQRQHSFDEFIRKGVSFYSGMSVSCMEILTKIERRDLL
jgi:archaellum biogenesis protein FlaJ (TadC family)